MENNNKKEMAWAMKFFAGVMIFVSSMTMMALSVILE